MEVAVTMTKIHVHRSERGSEWATAAAAVVTPLVLMEVNGVVVVSLRQPRQGGGPRMSKRSAGLSKINLETKKKVQVGSLCHRNHISIGLHKFERSHCVDSHTILIYFP